MTHYQRIYITAYWHAEGERWSGLVIGHLTSGPRYAYDDLGWDRTVDHYTETDLLSSLEERAQGFLGDDSPSADSVTILLEGNEVKTLTRKEPKVSEETKKEPEKKYVVRFRGRENPSGYTGEDIFLSAPVNAGNLVTDRKTVRSWRTAWTCATLDEAIEYTRRGCDLPVENYLPPDVVEIVAEQEEEETIVEGAPLVRADGLDRLGERRYVLRYWPINPDNVARYLHKIRDDGEAIFTSKLQDAVRLNLANALHYADRHPRLDSTRLLAQIVPVEVKPGERVLKLGEVA